MTDNVVNLRAQIAKKTGDGRKWTALDALKECVEKIESGEWDVEMIYVAMKSKAGDDGCYAIMSRCAGMTRVEALGLLQEHIYDTLHNV